MTKVPTISDTNRKNRFINKCFSECRPAFFVNATHDDKWAFVECDMLATDGWTTIEIGSHEVGTYAILSEETIEKMNEVADDYRDVESPAFSLSSFTTRYGALFMSFPKMEQKAAESLASHLAPLILDESNWTTPHTRLPNVEDR